MQAGVVTSKDAEQLIGQGWQYAGTLPNGKVVVKNNDSEEQL